MFATVSKGSTGDDIRLAIESPLHGVRFSDAEFREAIPGDRKSAYPHIFKVTIKGPNMDASAFVKAAPLKRDDTLPRYFDRIQDSWTGWDGERTWVSQRYTTREIHAWDDWPGPDNQLSITATSDWNGHISFRFDLTHRSERRFAENPPSGWTASITLPVQRAIVPDLARSIRNFLRRDVLSQPVPEQ